MKNLETKYFIQNLRFLNREEALIFTDLTSSAFKELEKDFRPSKDGKGRYFAPGLERALLGVGKRKSK